MPIPHIGEQVKAEVARQRLTHKEFGDRINKNEKTVPNIFKRAIIDPALLITISVALQKDFIRFYYKADGMEALREDENAQLKSEIQSLKENNEQLKEKLEDKQKVINAQELTITLVAEEREDFKTGNKSNTDPTTNA
jgi:uncharacterized protein YlxW (UPF0749 family)